VQRACRLADEGTVALLRTSVPVDERDSALATAAALIDGAGDRYHVAVLGVATLVERDGGRAAAIEILVVSPGGAA
jgi:hypothetical protein